MLAVLAVLGPGLIAANAGNDAGGIVTYASAGSQFAYRTLFLMVLVTVALVVVQEMCSRLGVYTGEGLGGLIREQFSARAAIVAMLLLLIANAGLTVSEFAGVGAAMEIFGVSPKISVPIAAVFVWALTVLGTYSRAERNSARGAIDHVAYDLMAGNKLRTALRQFTFDNVEIGPAHAAGSNPQQHVPGLQLGFRNVLNPKRMCCDLRRRSQHGSLHSGLQERASMIAPTITRLRLRLSRRHAAEE